MGINGTPPERPALKIVYQTGGKDEDGKPLSPTNDDTSYPFKLSANMSPPELMTVAWVMMYGGSEIVVIRGETHEAFKPVTDDLKAHPRIRRYTITAPGGVIVEAWSKR